MRREKRRHHNLEVWRDSLQLVEMIYQITSRFPQDERFGLVSQLRRASVSVPSNIAEGAARQTKSELIQFLHVARGSLAEIETQLQIAHRLKYLDENDALDVLLDRVFAKLNALIRSLKEKSV